MSRSWRLTRPQRPGNDCSPDSGQQVSSHCASSPTNGQLEVARLYASASTPLVEISRRFGIGLTSVARIAQRRGAPLAARPSVAPWLPTDRAPQSARRVRYSSWRRRHSIESQPRTSRSADGSCDCGSWTAVGGQPPSAGSGGPRPETSGASSETRRERCSCRRGRRQPASPVRGHVHGRAGARGVLGARRPAPAPGTWSHGDYGHRSHRLNLSIANIPVRPPEPRSMPRWAGGPGLPNEPGSRNRESVHDDGRMLLWSSLRRTHNY